MSGDHNMNQNDFNPDWLCTCGDLTVLGVVHRKGSFCYYPDKREWVGLTDDEVSAAVDDCDVYFDDEFLVDFARRIEAKLKEKNT